MKARLSYFFLVVATAIECVIIALGIAFAIVALMNGFGNGPGSGFCSIDASFN
jgi:hypothetical protein